MSVLSNSIQPCPFSNGKCDSTATINSIDAPRSYHISQSRGIPKVSSITRSPSVLFSPDMDLGLLDMCFDDGLNEELNDTMRSLRFSKAASNLDALFGQSSFDNLRPSSPNCIKVLSQKDSTVLTKKNQALRFSLSSAKSEKEHDDLSPQADSVSQIDARLGFLDSEPVTPPGSVRKSLEGDGRSCITTPRSVVGISKKSSSSIWKSRTKTSFDPEVVVWEDSGSSYSRTASPRKAKGLAFPHGRKLSSLLRSWHEDVQRPLNGNESVSRGISRENVENQDPQLGLRASLKEGMKKFLSRFVV